MGERDLPKEARVVVIGGGAVGCSVLYHLAKRGWQDCVLLERNELTSGSTWHAAGNCPNYATSWTILQMQAYSNALYQELSKAEDYPINYHVTGSLRLAHTRERMAEFYHVQQMAKQMGLVFDVLSPAEAQGLYPFLQVEGLQGALWDPLDGDIDPAQLTQVLARRARQAGATVVRFCEVTAAEWQQDGWLLSTTQGEIRCEFVVNAAGYRAVEVGRLFGRSVPSAVMAHQYLITDSIAELEQREQVLPLLRDPDSSYYLRQEKKCLLLGPYEKNCRAHWVGEVMPDDFSFQLFDDDLERLDWYIEDACRRVPILATGGVKRVVNGPIPYAPDGLPLIGAMPAVPQAYEACVFTFGIVQAGGAGKLLADIICDGEPEADSWAVSPYRFTDFATADYTVAKAVETYGNEYAIHFPHQQWAAGRPTLQSPLYEVLQEAGARMGVYGGWERADYFSHQIEHVIADYNKPPWFAVVGEECRQVAARAGVLDLTGFARFRLVGSGAKDWLMSVSCSRCPRVGRVGLAYFATPKGRVLSEMTVTRFADDDFWLMSAAGARWHDRDWLVSHLPKGSGIELQDVTADYGSLLLAGPLSSDVMEKLTGDDFSQQAFPWLSHRSVVIEGVSVIVLRVSFTGDRGFELHVPMAAVAVVYRAVLAAGQEYGVVPFGMLALESMRLEKGYRSWKGDLIGDYSLLECGLSRFVDFDRGDFIGRSALLGELPTKCFGMLVLDSAADGEFDGDVLPLSVVYDGDRAVGLVLSAGYGHRTECFIALVVVDGAVVGRDSLWVAAFGGRRGARWVDAVSLYDVDNEKCRG